MLDLFDTYNPLVREFMNGTWAVSSFILIIALLLYIWNASRTSRFSENVGMQFAAALSVLLTGHFIRSFFTWMEFTKELSTGGPIVWSKYSPPFLFLGTVTLLLGKALVLYTFTPFKWRWPVLLSFTAVTLGIPLLVYLYA